MASSTLNNRSSTCGDYLESSFHVTSSTELELNNLPAINFYWDALNAGYVSVWVI